MFDANRKLSDLSDTFRPKVERWLSKCKQAGLDILVTETKRSKARQFFLWCKGRVLDKRLETKYLGYTDPTITGQPMEPQVTWSLNSNHLSGNACDFCFLRDGVPIWSGDWALAHSIAIECGMKGIKGDLPHLEDNSCKDL